MVSPSPEKKRSRVIYVVWVARLDYERIHYGRHLLEHVLMVTVTVLEMVTEVLFLVPCSHWWEARTLRKI